MVRKSFKIFLILFQIVLVLLIAAIGGFLWRLHRAPIEVNGIIPYIAHAFSSSDTPVNVHIDSAVLTWGKASRPIDLIARNFKIRSADGDLITSVPEMSFSFSLTALLKGTIAPRTIAIYRPYLHLYINREGQIKSSPDDTAALPEEENTSDKPTVLPVRQVIEYIRRETYITEFSLVDARVKITDNYHNALWDIPSVNLTYEHTSRKNKLEGNIILKTRTVPLALSVDGSWRERRKEMLLSLQVQNVNLSRLTIAQEYPVLKNFTTPVGISVHTQLNLAPLLKTNRIDAWREAVRRIEFILNGGAGVIHLPAPVLATYDLESFSARGAWYDNGDKLDISSFEIKLKTGSGFGNLSVQGIGPALDTKNWESIRAVMNATALNVPVDKLHLYWPGSITPDVHEWVRDNMHGGMIDEGIFTLHFAGLKDEPGIDSEKVQGTVKVSHTQVSYMDDMPPVEDVSGTVHLTRDVVDIDITQGHTFDIRLTDGTVSFYDLIQEISHTKIDLNMEGRLTDALKILDQPPLGFTKDMGIIPEKVTGSVSGNLKLQMPVGDGFTGPEQIKINASAHISDAVLNDIVLDYGLQDVSMDVSVENQDVNGTGKGLFYSSPADFTIYQNFDPAQKLKTKINFNAVLNDETRRNFDFGSGLLIPPSLTGPLKVSLLLTEQRDNSGNVDASFDLSGTGIYIRPIGWQKAAGIKGSGKVRLTLKDSGLTGIPSFSFTDARGTLIRGSASFGRQNNTLEKIELNPIRTGRTNAKARLRLGREDSVKIDITGASLDITGLLNDPEAMKKAPEEEETEEKTDSTLTINAAVDRIWLSKAGYTRSNALYAFRQGERWKRIDAVGRVGSQDIPLHFSFYPNPGKPDYSYVLTSGDAGGTLQAMDYINSIRGGRLEARGNFTPGLGSRGSLFVSEFRMVEMPIFTRILMLTSFSGIVDMFKGEGLVFNSAEVPYRIDETSVTIKDAVVAGSSLGITLNGKYYRDSGYLNFRGSLIPFYSINSFLGKIPYIGRIFAGEKGGGLIAPTYTVKGKLPSPAISVNAFSALAPGAARELFDKITSNDADLSKNEKQMEENIKEISESVEEELKEAPKIPEALWNEKKTELPPPLMKIDPPAAPEEKILNDSLQHSP